MIFVLSGPVHSGKTSLLQRIVLALKGYGYTIDGFLSVSIREKDEIIGYDLFDLGSAESFPFIRRKGEQGWQRIGSFFFIPESLEKAHQIILREREGVLLVIDEIGPLELEGRGLWPALQKVLFSGKMKCLVVIRKGLLEGFIQKLGGIEIKIFDIHEQDIYTRILKELK